MRTIGLMLAIVCVVGSATAQTWPRNPGDLPGRDGTRVMTPPSVSDLIDCVTTANVGNCMSSFCIGTPVTWVGWKEEGPPMTRVPGTDVFILDGINDEVALGIVVADGSFDDGISKFWFPSGYTARSSVCRYLFP